MTVSYPKLYLDNCCYNRPFDDQSQLLVRLETEAILFILDQIKNGACDLVWSYMLDLENSDNPFERKQESILRWKSRAIIDIVETDEVIRNAETCTQFGLKPKDALHVACALEARANYFITVDRGILRRRIEGIIIINPIQFVQQGE